MITELIEHLDSYLLGRIDLTSLEDWLVSNLQAVLDSSNRKAINMVNQVDADMVELQEGLLDEPMIRKRLQGYLMEYATIPIQYGQVDHVSEQASTSASTATTTIVTEFPIKLVEDVRFQASFA